MRPIFSAIAFPNVQCAAICALIGLSCTLSIQAQAQITTTIQTPPSHAIAELSTVQSLQDLTLANLIASNCDIQNLTKGDAALIGGTAQAVAAQMGLSMDAYMVDYLQAAIKELSVSDACVKYADKTMEITNRLKVLGGVVMGE